MKETIEKIVWKYPDSEMIRYLFSGGCTTALNLFIFFLLRAADGVSVNTANFCSIGTAVVFAFGVNRWFVFEKRDGKSKQILKEFVQFLCMRAGTMALEFFGVMILCQYAGLQDVVSKGLLQIVIIISNYVISKFIVFREKAEV